jgi:FMN phosphatase YigB (HAD superfamily)
VPPGWVNYSISQSAPNGAWQLLETGRVGLDARFFAHFNRDLHDSSRWQAFLRLPPQSQVAVSSTQLPNIDGEELFNEMMRYSSQPDPWMLPGLKKLKASGHYLIAALSNTVIFPPGHDLYRTDFFNDPVRSLFDVFVSSAHVGLRKPDPAIYRLALREMNQWAAAHSTRQDGRAQMWEGGIAAEDVLFLDDIGENLRAARELGFRTMKVNLGKSYKAVEQLEEITGLDLAGKHPCPDISSAFQRRERPKI